MNTVLYGGSTPPLPTLTKSPSEMYKVGRPVKGSGFRFCYQFILKRKPYILKRSHVLKVSRQ